MKSTREIDRIFREGAKAGDPLLAMFAVRTPEERGPEGRAVFIAGKRIGGAVQRNRCKRVLREACRRAGCPWRGWDVAFIARERLPEADPPQIDEAVRRLRKKLGLDS